MSGNSPARPLHACVTPVHGHHGTIGLDGKGTGHGNSTVPVQSHAERSFLGIRPAVMSEGDTIASVGSRDSALERSPSPNSPTDDGVDSVDPLAETDVVPGGIPWADLLATPELAAFSPSKDANKPDNVHGMGLRLALDRSRNLNRSSRRAVVFLLDTATLYENYAQSLVKATQLLQPAIGQQANLPALSVQESLLSWSGEVQRLAKAIRSRAAQPFQNFLVSHTETVSGVQQRYWQSRQKTIQLRQKAQSYRLRYLKAANEADQALVEWKDENRLGESTDSSEEKRPKRLESKIEEAERLQGQYQRYVRRENDAVRQCQLLEAMALECLQNVEEDRLFIFVQCMIDSLMFEKEAVDEMMISLKESAEDKVVTETIISDKKESKPFMKLLKNSSNGLSQLFDDGSGAMDADTLGLPEEIGQLRDTVRSKMALRAVRVQVGRALSSFLESVATASARLSNGILQQLRKLDTKSGDPDQIRQCEGERTLRIWDSLTTSLQTEADGAILLASSLRTLRTDKLDVVVMYAEKSTKTAADTEENMWKQLCEAARSQGKAENRYRLSAAQSEKARERVQSVDSAGASGGSGNTDTGQSPIRGNRKVSSVRVNTKVSKGLANMFSILPDGGEQAMKMFHPGARASIAQQTLVDADEKEEQLRRTLDLAVEASAKALEAYRLNSEALLSHYGTEEKSGLDEMRAALEEFVSGVQAFRESRQDSLTNALSCCSKLHVKQTKIDVQDFANSIRKQIQKKASESKGMDRDGGFMLAECLEQFQALGGDRDDDDNIDDELFDDQDGEVEHLSETQNLDHSIPVLDQENEGIQDSSTEHENKQSQTWLRRQPFAHPSSLSNLPNGIALKKLSLRSNLRRRNRIHSEQPNQEVDILLTYFWSEPMDILATPQIALSFPCSFRDGSQRLPSQYGRVYLTNRRFLFVSWTGKKLVLTWPDVLAIKLSKRSFTANNDTIRVTCRKGIDEESYMVLGGIVNYVEKLATIKRARADALAALEEVKHVVSHPVDIKAMEATTDEVPPDETLGKMEVVLTKHIRKISIQRFYDIVWSEGQGTTEKPLYLPWLERACHDIDMSTWDFAPCTGSWCGETYAQKRHIKFKIRRKTHLYIGPPIATVKQTHYCRVEGNDKCVLGMTIEFEGVPYCDTFAVEVRWVARREGVDDILVQVGVFVDFKKNTFLKSKIRSGTIEETAPVHRTLFESAQAACIAAGGEKPSENDETLVLIEATAKGNQTDISRGLQKNNFFIFACCGLVLALITWRIFIAHVRQGNPAFEADSLASSDVTSLGHRMNSLEVEIKAMHETLKEILEVIKTQQ